MFAIDEAEDGPEDLRPVPEVSPQQPPCLQSAVQLPYELGQHVFSNGCGVKNQGIGDSINRGNQFLLVINITDNGVKQSAKGKKSERSTVHKSDIYLIYIKVYKLSYHFSCYTHLKTTDSSIPFICTD